MCVHREMIIRLWPGACSAHRLPDLRGYTTSLHLRQDGPITLHDRSSKPASLLAIGRRTDHPRICRRFDDRDNPVTLGLPQERSCIYPTSSIF
jgi:hypothetical protein